MTVLIVDDSFMFRAQLREDLEDAGYAVVEAESGVAGLRVLQDGARPKLIISDINMPDMDGLAFVDRALAALDEAAPHVFVLSAERSEQARRQARASGVKAWIVKPYNKDALLAAVHKVAG